MATVKPSKDRKGFRKGKKGPGLQARWRKPKKAT